MNDLLDLAHLILVAEAKGIEHLSKSLDSSLEKAIKLLFKAKGNIIVSGVGKSGIVGRKIAATFTSLGSRAVFLHPIEALHGDLGITGRGDIAILISHSGSSEELLGLLPHLQARKIPIISITGNPSSHLARSSTVALNTFVSEEACPECRINLAPTLSTTVTLALGDVLALLLAELKGFEPKDFAKSHPGGALGKRAG